ncbi:hypothetical protein [Variovorax sp. UC122_21]|uniref:phage tail tube protein n=1 Tax=Variovorax sp. UC122_21 TaxID=3374554 RepID=UPI003756A370
MSDAQAILGAGKMQLNMFNPSTQAYAGWGDAIGADRFEITPDSDEKQKTSKARENYGQAIAAVPIAKPSKIVIVISAADKTALAMQFQGQLATYSQGSGAIDETVTAKLDKWVSLSKRNVSDTAFAVKKASDNTPYTIHQDYEVDYASGAIKALSGGAIAADESLKVTGTAAAVSGTRIRGGTVPKVRAQARFVGVNMVDDSPMRVEVWEAQLRSTQGFDFLADDFNGIQLEGTLVIPAGKTEPYVVDFDNPSA